MQLHLCAYYMLHIITIYKGSLLTSLYRRYRVRVLPSAAPEKVAKDVIVYWFRPYWRKMQYISAYYYYHLIHPKKKKKHNIFITYHWGTNGDIQMTSPASAGYLFMKIEDAIRIDFACGSSRWKLEKIRENTDITHNCKKTLNIAKRKFINCHWLWQRQATFLRHFRTC